jgi:hypothetical protein
MHQCISLPLTTPLPGMNLMPAMEVTPDYVLNRTHVVALSAPGFVPSSDSVLVGQVTSTTSRITVACGIGVLADPLPLIKSTASRASKVSASFSMHKSTHSISHTHKHTHTHTLSLSYSLPTHAPGSPASRGTRQVVGGLLGAQLDHRVRACRVAPVCAATHDRRHAGVCVCVCVCACVCVCVCVCAFQAM